MSLHFRKHFLAAERFESAGIFDVDGDGIPDIVSGGFWYQGPDFKKQHKIGNIKAVDEYYDDFSTIPLDIDGDGQCELVTGKRFRAHPQGDAGDKDPYGWYVFKWTGESFVKHVIDFGPMGTGKGLGIHFAIGDLTGNGTLDVVAPGKDGLVIYFNEGV